MIEWIEIENYRCLEELRIEGFKQVNLIGGRNNVGKSSFLEVVELNSAIQKCKSVRDINLSISTLRKILSRRSPALFNTVEGKELKETQFITEGDDYLVVASNISTFLIGLPYSDIKENLDLDVSNDSYQHSLFPHSDENYIIGFNGEYFSVPPARVQERTRVIPRSVEAFGNFIESGKVMEHKLSGLYGYVVRYDRESELNESLKLFDENIRTLKLIPGERKNSFLVQYRDSLIPLSSLGEGLNRFIAILCAIWASKDDYLVIDEIENGIHYTAFPLLWKLIFQASYEANCQVFAATHSKECIQAFNQAWKDSEDDSGAYYELARHRKTDKIVGLRRDQEQLDYALTQDMEIRGE